MLVTVPSFHGLNSGTLIGQAAEEIAERKQLPLTIVPWLLSPRSDIDIG
jgi:hypothetical protein